ncbi:hypothetical protein BDV95DRAFT_533851 [Massariosphaeria phaeospora]|uniref:DUF7053 domain-containing protein n=1 Tax=Massariosphaeria phaeospora TaxID=100035 RepID=A0A7C8IIG9_9PLEO|nr:hypothetical protein BDV95DRAFT_533851 [Massariosphaeria phaeospora]
MSKTSVFTSITPLPAGITRQTVMETYRSHTELIELNPLVVDRFKCKPPSYAPADEFYSTWYTIKDKVSYLPGGLASGSVSYHACFHDLPEGLQTHVYAPLGLDIRAKWSIGGTLPGEPKQPVELGLGIPRDGLYIREDVKMKCNIMMISFVKKTFKDSHAKLVDRLVEKAHILESNVANERLKALRNVDPGERMGHGDIFIAPPPGYQASLGHQRMRSNGSNQSTQTSPSLSQASTLTSHSSFIGCVPHEPGHRRAPSYPHDQKPDQSSHHRTLSHARTQKSDGGLTLLPATTYDPNQHYNTEKKGCHYAYSPLHSNPAGLLVDAPPVPPKDIRDFIAELPA